MKSLLLQRSRSCLISLATLLFTALPAISRADDHGSTSSTATVVTLPATLNGEIEVGGDTDYFKFTLTAPSLVTVVSGGNTDVKGTLMLGGARGVVTEIYSDNDSAGLPNFKLTQTLPVGTHYMYVRGSTTSVVGPYTLDFQASTPAPEQPDIAVGVGGTNLAAGTLLDYGTAATGSQTPKDIEIANVGDAELRVYGVRIAITGTMPTGAAFPWRILASASPVVQPGRQTNCRLAFQPTVAGTYNAKITVASSDGDEIFYDFNVRGIATGAMPEPEIVVRNGTLDVETNGSIDLGSTMANVRLTKAITIANTGSGELRIISSVLAPAVTGTPLAFSIYNSTVPSVIPAGGSATFTVALFNLTEGSYAAKLTLANNDANENPTVINLTGTVTQDPVQGEIGIAVGGTNVANNTAVSYGNAYTGVQTIKDFVVTNSGGSELRITGWGFYLPPPATVTIPTTTAVGSTTATVDSAALLAPGMSVSNPFPSGTTITSIVGTTLTLSAAATSTTIAANAIYYTGGVASTVNAFSVIGAVPTAIAAGASTTIKVAYTPMQPGNHAVTLRLFNNDLDENPFAINLSGHADLNPNPGDIAVSLSGANVAANSDVDWGAVAVGTTALKTFTITNTGTGELRLTSLYPTAVQPLLTTTTPMYFYFSGTPANVLAPGASGSLIVIFKPALVGTSYRATVNLYSTDPDENPYRFNVIGTGAPVAAPVPEIAINVNGGAVANNGTFGFGAVNGGTLTQKSLLINNTGNAPLTLSSLSVGLPVGSPAGAANPFAIIGTQPITIGANSAYSTWVNFAPTTAGDYSGVLQLGNNDSDENPYTINLTGTGLTTVSAPELSLSLAGVDVPQNGSVPFGSIATGTTVSKQFTVTNTGDAALTLSAWLFYFPNGSNVGVSTTTTLGSPVATVSSGTSLVPGMTVSGSLFPNNTTVVSIAGNSVTFSSPAITAATNSFISYYQPGLPVTNQFRFDGTPPSSVAAGATATFTVTYAPIVAGNHSMVARFSSNDISENPYQFIVSGSATGTTPAPEIGVTLAGVDQPLGSTVAYGNTTPGIPLSKQFVITNTGNAALALSGWSFINPAPAITSFGPLTLGASTSTLTTYSGISAGMVVVSSALPAGTTVVSITGNSVTFSAPATATSTSTAFTFYPAGTGTVNPFATSGALPSSIAAGASATITVNYAPAAAGTHSMNFRFSTNDSNESPYQLTLTGSASGTPVVPEIGVSLASVDQANNSTVAYGSTSVGVAVSKQFVISNTGAGTLNLSGWTLGLPFTFGSTLPSSIAPGANATVTVKYSPTAAGSHSATFRVTNNDSDESPYTLTLTGSALLVAPEIGITLGGADVPLNGTANFGTTNVGTSVTKQFVVANTGTANLFLSNWAFTGTTTPNPFGFSGALPSLIAPGATATVNVNYLSTVVGTQTMQLRVTTNDSNENPYLVTVTGTSIPTPVGPEIDVKVNGITTASGGSFNFGSANSGVISTRTLTIANTGTTALTISGLSATTAAGTANPFGVSGLPPFTVAAGSSYSVSLLFAPTTAGSYTGTLQISSNDSDEGSYIVNLAGTAISTVAAPEMNMLLSGADVPMNSTVAYGNIAAGGLVTKQFTISNTGTASLNVTNSLLSLPSGSTIYLIGATTLGSTTATVTGSTSALAPGMTIGGPFPVGTSLVSIAGQTLTFSAPAISSVTNYGLTLYKAGVPIINQFKTDTLPASTIAAGASSTFNVTYAPTVAGSHSMILTVYSNDISENPYYVVLTGSATGTAPSPEIGMAVAGVDQPLGSTVDFGTAATGSTVSKQLVISNTGAASLSLSGWSFLNPALAINSSLNITAGLTSGTLNGTIGITPGMVVVGPFSPGTTIVSLAGNVATFSAPSAITSTAYGITLYPAGTNTANPFTMSGILPLSIAAGASATVTVNYTPVLAGTQTMLLRITNNDANENPFQVALTGSATGEPALPEIGVSLAGANVPVNGSVAYGSTGVGTTVSKQFMIANTGNATLNLSTYSITPTATPVIVSTTTTLGSSIGTVTSATGLSAGMVVSGSTLPVGTSIVSISGNLVTFSAAATGSFGGASFSYYPAGTNTANYFRFDGTTGSIAPGATGIITVTYAPTAVGNHNMVVRFVTNDTDEGTYQFFVSGSAIVAPSAPEIDVRVSGLGIASGGSFDFGSVNGGSSTGKSLTIYNTGNSVLTVASASVSSAGATNPFGLFAIAPLTINPGASYGLNLVFAPTVTGSYTGTVSIGSDDSDEALYTLSLTGTAVSTVAAPEIAISVDSNDVTQGSMVAFGATTSGGPVVSKTFTISNTGDATLNLTGRTMSYPSSAVVSGVTTTSTAGSATATVSSSANLAVGMTVSSNFPVGTAITAISGNTLTFSAPALTSAASGITYFKVGVPSTNQFRFDGTMPATLAAGASTTITVTYAPQIAGDHSMVVAINSNDLSENPLQFLVTGSSTGVAPAPEIDISNAGNSIPVGGSFSYGSVYTGTVNSASFLVSNSGVAPLTLSSWSFVNPATPLLISGSTSAGSSTVTLSTVAGVSVGMVASGSGISTGVAVVSIAGNTVTFSAPSISTSVITTLSFYPAGTNLVNPFAFSGTTPTSIAAGASAVVTVNFSPTAAGSYNMLLRVNSNDTNENPYQITLNGTATLNPAAPDVAVFSGTTELPQNTAVDFGNTSRGITVFKDFTIKNLGSAALTQSTPSFVTLLPQPAPTASPFFLSSYSPSTGAGGTSTLRIGFTPQALSTSYSSRIAINTNDPDEATYILTLNGATSALDSEISVANDGTDIPVNGNLAYGTTQLGTIVAKTITVTNTGTGPLGISGVTFSPTTGSFPTTTIAPFYVTSWPGSIAAGSTANIVINYRPVLTLHQRQLVCEHQQLRQQ